MFCQVADCEVSFASSAVTVSKLHTDLNMNIFNMNAFLSLEKLIRNEPHTCQEKQETQIYLVGCDIIVN